MMLIRSSSRQMLIFCSIQLFTLAFPAVASFSSEANQDFKIWFCPTLSKTNDQGEHYGSVDFDRLFDDSAPWTTARSHTAVFKTYLSHVQTESDEQMRREFAFLKRHNIKFALEFGPMNRDPNGCGGGIEGWGNGGAKTAAQIAQKIAKNGGELSYLAMDEPFWGDRFMKNVNACHLTDVEMAKNAHVTVQAFRSFFPRMEVGDIEPLQVVHDGNLLTSYAGWLDAWAGVDGKPMSFFHVDALWDGGDVDGRINALGQMIEEKGTRFGLIYNGNRTDNSDMVWTERAQYRYKSYEKDGRLAPEDVIFQSWVAHPDHLLPEIMEGTHTNLILGYLQWKRGLAVDR